MRLAHPNVCHIVRLGETEDGLVYVVMPFVEGEILADRNEPARHASRWPMTLQSRAATSPRGCTWRTSSRSSIAT